MLLKEGPHPTQAETLHPDGGVGRELALLAVRTQWPWCGREGSLLS